VAITPRLFGNFPLNALKKTIDLLNDDIRATLHTVTYVPDQDVHDFVNDLTNEVASGGGYTTGGVSLAGKTLTYNAGTNTVTFDANDVQWASSTITARSAVFSDRTPGTAATQPLIGYQLSDADISSTGGNYDLIFNASGVLTMAVS
jgi:hypothetical protein